MKNYEIWYFDKSGDINTFKLNIKNTKMNLKMLKKLSKYCKTTKSGDYYVHGNIKYIDYILIPIKNHTLTEMKKIVKEL